MSHNIKKMTEQQVNDVVAKVMSMDWENPRVYADFLAQIHHYINHTTRILAAAGSRFPLEQQSLHVQCMRHAGEEKGHENLSMNDIKKLGFRLEDFSELPSTKALYRSIYYLVERESPVAILGYAYFLECFAVVGGLKILEVIEPLYGKDAVKHIAVHAKEDPEHIEAVEAVIASLSREDLAHVEEAMLTTAVEVTRMLDEVQQRAGVKKLRLVA